jgi:ankyrin repeat protein
MIPCLLDAVRLGEVEIARPLLDQGADIETSSPACETLLYLAAERGHAALVALLLERLEHDVCLNVQGI